MPSPCLLQVGYLNAPMVGWFAKVLFECVQVSQSGATAAITDRLSRPGRPQRPLVIFPEVRLSGLGFSQLSAASLTLHRGHNRAQPRTGRSFCSSAQVGLLRRCWLGGGMHIRAAGG